MNNTKDLELKVKELDLEAKELEKEYAKAIQSGLNEHAECCKDICITINKTIEKLKEKIEEIEKISSIGIIPKASASREIKYIKERYDTLSDMNNKLKSKGICDCTK